MPSADPRTANRARGLCYVCGTPSKTFRCQDCRNDLNARRADRRGALVELAPDIVAGLDAMRSPGVPRQQLANALLRKAIARDNARACDALSEYARSPK